VTKTICHNKYNLCDYNKSKSSVCENVRTAYGCGREREIGGVREGEKEKVRQMKI
jgi:hypothetical protein